MTDWGRRAGTAVLLSTVVLTFTGCPHPTEENLAPFIHSAVEHGLMAVDKLSEQGKRLDDFVKESEFPTKEVVCFVSQNSTYNSSTGAVTLPSEAELESKFQSKIFPNSIAQQKLRAAYGLVAALTKEEIARVAADAGCAV